MKINGIEITTPEEVIKKLDDLTPWDKKRVAKYIVEKHYDLEDFKHLADCYGYVDANSKSVCEDAYDAVNEFGEDEILDAIWFSNIVNYVCERLGDSINPRFRNQLRNNLKEYEEIDEKYIKNNK